MGRQWLMLYPYSNTHTLPLRTWYYLLRNNYQLSFSTYMFCFIWWIINFIMAGTICEFFLHSQPRLARGAFDGKRASFTSRSHEIEKISVGKWPRDGTTLTNFVSPSITSSHTPNLLLCEMWTIKPTLQSVGYWGPMTTPDEKGLVRKYTNMAR